MNPLIGVILITLGLGAMVVFSVFHISQEMIIPVGVVTAGIAIVQANAHAATTKNLTVLKNSIHPPPVNDNEK